MGKVKADPGEVEQMIINLTVNAKDTMPHGGTLTIATVNLELDEQQRGRRHLGALLCSEIVNSVTDTRVVYPKKSTYKF